MQRSVLRLPSRSKGQTHPALPRAPRWTPWFGRHRARRHPVAALFRWMLAVCCHRCTARTRSVGPGENYHPHSFRYSMVQRVTLPLTLAGKGVCVLSPVQPRNGATVEVRGRRSQTSLEQRSLGGGWWCPLRQRCNSATVLLRRASPRASGPVAGHGLVGPWPCPVGQECRTTSPLHLIAQAAGSAGPRQDCSRRPGWQSR